MEWNSNDSWTDSLTIQKAKSFDCSSPQFFCCFLNIQKSADLSLKLTQLGWLVFYSRTAWLPILGTASILACLNTSLEAYVCICMYLRRGDTLHQRYWHTVNIRRSARMDCFLIRNVTDGSKLNQQMRSIVAFPSRYSNWLVAMNIYEVIMRYPCSTEKSWRHYKAVSSLLGILRNVCALCRAGTRNWEDRVWIECRSLLTTRWACNGLLNFTIWYCFCSLPTHMTVSGAADIPCWWFLTGIKLLNCVFMVSQWGTGWTMIAVNDFAKHELSYY